MIRSGLRRVARNIVVALGLTYVFTIVLILKTILWQPHMTSSSTESFGRTVFVHFVWSLGYFPAAFVAGAVSSLVFESRHRWAWFALSMACILSSLVSQDLRTWHEPAHRGAALIVAMATVSCAVAGFWLGERRFWSGHDGAEA